jgi:hypothetical protein
VVVTSTEIVGILVGSCYTILTKDLKIHHTCQYYLPIILMWEHCDDCIRDSG